MGKFPILRLPFPLREKVYAMACTSWGNVNLEDSTIEVQICYCDDSMTPPLCILFPDFVDSLRPLLTYDNDKQYQQEIRQFLGRRCRFWSPRAEFLYTLPLSFGSDDCNMIQHLTIEMNSDVQCRHELTWPASIKLLTDSFSSLRHLEVYTSTPDTALRYPESESGDPEDALITVHQQSLRSLLRFIAFVVLRHPKLKRAILPGDFARVVEITDYLTDQKQEHVNYRVVAEQSYIDRPGDLQRRWNRHTRSKEGDDTQDEVLNTSAIRKIKWTTLANIELSELIIQPSEGSSRDDIVLSDTHHNDRQLELIDRFAYRKKKELRAWGIRHRPVDQLIDMSTEQENDVDAKLTAGRDSEEQDEQDKPENRSKRLEFVAKT